MKVHEALNLYNLHSKPQQLKGHDEVSAKLQAEYSWAYFYMDRYTNKGAPHGKAGHSQLNESWIGGFFDEGDLETSILPCDIVQVWKFLEKAKEAHFSGKNGLIHIGRYNRRDEDAHDHNAHIVSAISGFDNAEDVVYQASKKFTPKSMWLLNYDDTIFAGIYECDPAIYRMFAGEMLKNG